MGCSQSKEKPLSATAKASKKDGDETTPLQPAKTDKEETSVPSLPPPSQPLSLPEKVKTIATQTARDSTFVCDLDDSKDILRDNNVYNETRKENMEIEKRHKTAPTTFHPDEELPYENDQETRLAVKALQQKFTKRAVAPYELKGPIFQNKVNSAPPIVEPTTRAPVDIDDLPYTTVVFQDGPLGMTLQPTKNDVACRVMNFLDDKDDSPARASGLIDIGDVIVSVNGVEMFSYDGTIHVLQKGGVRIVEFRVGTSDDEYDESDSEQSSSESETGWNSGHEDSSIATSEGGTSSYITEAEPELLPDPSPEKALLPVVDDDNVKLATIDDNANDSVAFKVVDDSTTKEKKGKKEKKLKKDKKEKKSKKESKKTENKSELKSLSNGESDIKEVVPSSPVKEKRSKSYDTSEAAAPSSPSKEKKSKRDNNFEVLAPSSAVREKKSKRDNALELAAPSSPVKEKKSKRNNTLEVSAPSSPVKEKKSKRDDIIEVAAPTSPTKEKKSKRDNTIEVAELSSPVKEKKSKHDNTTEVAEPSSPVKEKKSKRDNTIGVAAPSSPVKEKKSKRDNTIAVAKLSSPVKEAKDKKTKTKNKSNEYEVDEKHTDAKPVQQLEENAIPFKRPTIPENETDKDKFLRLLSLGHSKKSTEGIDDGAMLGLIRERPDFFKYKYKFDSLSEEVYPLTMMCATKANVETIKECIDVFPRALKDNDTYLGNPLHYACSYKASPDVLRHLIGRNVMLATEKNAADRTPLHLACISKASLETVKLLVNTYDHAAMVADMDKNLPLHYVCDKGVSLPVLQEVLATYPNACVSQNAKGQTPLHIAVNCCEPKGVIKMLIKAGLGAISYKDSEGNMPLHVSVLKDDTPDDVILYLVKKFDQAKHEENNKSEIPYEIAKNTRPNEHALHELLEP